MTASQWKLLARFMFVVIYILNRYVKTSAPENNDYGWQLEFLLLKELE